MNRTVIAPPPAPDILYMKEALKEANEGIKAGDGGPFGCVIVKGDRIAEGRTDLVAAFSDFKDLVGFERFRELEKEYLPRFVE